LVVRGEKVYRGISARIHRIGYPQRWNEYAYEMRLPSRVRPSDRLRVYVWYPHAPTPLWLDEFEVTLIE